MIFIQKLKRKLCFYLGIGEKKNLYLNIEILQLVFKKGDVITININFSKFKLKIL